ncbi:alcohol dehydrogenase (plasmid) [Ensifer adhaerens]|uniref:Quinone oxidoreductase n=1 Tax=Ensifer adhaerens TaxID=106592 RepID=A0ABY8HTR9_ENSAD|nr:quinone oxidoreductase [Ensifer adhaerens]ANK77481.1 alcohol dehydrogenase [Ensifer adhaerens]KDP72316.1 alcohol dehydrogenase [Ensifer adhaerens]WFP94749.1 quinone oxidoreductase [Ensifer adhaerens]
MKAVVMNGVGDSDVMEFVERPEPVATPGHVIVEVRVAGVNFMDIGVRQGMAWTETPNPKVLGVEGAGRVLSVGDGVTDLAVGDHVAWVYAPGSYSERLSIPATSLVKVPDFIDDRTAASIMMQGLTASHFATDFYAVQPGDIALVHAAAGGVGLLLTQIIKLRGGRVIGRVSSKDKVAIAQNAGAEHVIVDTEGEFVNEVLHFTGGRGVDVVYDGSGPKTFKASLEVLRRSGTLCWYGPVLGGPGPLDIMSLPKSVKIGYGVFFDHIHSPELFRERDGRLFDWIADGSLKVTAGGSYPLKDAAQAHKDMASRKTTGKLLLIPGGS